MKENNAGPVICVSLLILGIVLIGAPLLLGHAPLQSASPPTTSYANQEASPDLNAGKLAVAHQGGAVAHLAPAGQSSSALITTNNNAVALMGKGKIDDAIELLEPLLKSNPDYGLARDNLAIAYNNQALKQTESPKIALDSLWRSSCLNPAESKTAENIDAMLQVLHKQPKKFEDRVAMADAQATEGCLYGAYAEYKAALAVHDDPAVQQKLKVIEKQAANCGDDDINGAFFVKMAGRKPGARQAGTAAGGDNVDFGPYMAHLQKTIKRNWLPPRKDSSKRMQVMFAVAKDGTISNVKVFKSSGDADEDQAGLAAVKSLGKADPLPPGSPPSVDIQFSFDYNVNESNGGD